MKHLRLLLVSLRVSFVTSMQYRWNFAVGGFVSFLWTGLGLVPLAVAFGARPEVAGWSFHQALLVVGWFTLLKGLLDGAVNPSLLAVVEHIRQGTLDFVLLKPVDAQFLVSTAKFELWKGLDAVAALVLFGWAFRGLGEAPGLGRIAASLALAACAALVLYSIWILVIAAAFYVVRLDNLAYLLSSVFDFARWPVSVFKGPWRFFFTFVVPLGVMTTFPAQALLGTLEPATAAWAALGSLVFAICSRAAWKFALGRYTSASS